MNTRVLSLALCTPAFLLMSSAALLQSAPTSNVIRAIPRYTLGTPVVARSPMTDADFELLKKTLLFTNEDVQALRLAGKGVGRSS